MPQSQLKQRNRHHTVIRSLQGARDELLSTLLRIFTHVQSIHHCSAKHESDRISEKRHQQNKYQQQ